MCSEISDAHQHSDATQMDAASLATTLEALLLGGGGSHEKANELQRAPQIATHLLAFIESQLQLPSSAATPVLLVASQILQRLLRRCPLVLSTFRGSGE